MESKRSLDLLVDPFYWLESLFFPIHFLHHCDAQLDSGRLHFLVIGSINCIWTSRKVYTKIFFWFGLREDKGDGRYSLILSKASWHLAVQVKAFFVLELLSKYWRVGSIFLLTETIIALMQPILVWHRRPSSRSCDYFLFYLLLSDILPIFLGDPILSLLKASSYLRPKVRNETACVLSRSGISATTSLNCLTYWRVVSFGLSRTWNREVTFILNFLLFLNHVHNSFLSSSQESIEFGVKDFIHSALSGHVARPNLENSGDENQEGLDWLNYSHWLSYSVEMCFKVEMKRWHLLTALYPPECITHSHNQSSHRKIPLTAPWVSYWLVFFLKSSTMGPWCSRMFPLLFETLPG